MSKYLTTNESMQLLGVTTRTLRRYVARGLLSKVTEKGRVLYPEDELLRINAQKNKRGALSLIEERVAQLVAKNTVLETRIRVLELALSSRQPDVKLADEEVKELRSAVTSTSRQKDISFETVASWAEDLLRIDRDTCAKIGFKRLAKLVDRLILCAEAAIDTYIEPSRLITLDKLRLFRVRLDGYGATTSAPSAG